MNHNLAAGWPIFVMVSYTGDNPGKEVRVFIFKPVGEF